MSKNVNITENLTNASEVVFIMDTTGSMNPCIANVRNHIEKTCEELFKDIPNLKIGLIAHGDYCDGDNCYKLLPLTDDKEKIFEFVRTAPNTGGGDAEECYELALNLARGMGWSKDGSGKMVVMIGDAPPHEPSYNLNKDNLDWRVELNALKEAGINVYPLQCLYSEYSGAANNFWSSIAEICNTPLLKLDDFVDASSVLSSYTHATLGPEAFADYETKLYATGNVSKNAMEINSMLRGEAGKYKKGC